jgi:hypothetical protein
MTLAHSYLNASIGWRMVLGMVLFRHPDAGGRSGCSLVTRRVEWPADALERLDPLGFQEAAQAVLG